MEPMNTSRRNFLRLVGLGVPVSVALVACGGEPSQTGAGGGGGGGLKSYVDAGQVEDMSDFFAQNPELKDKIFPSAFGAATVNGKLYAMPIETVAPIVLFWNKKMFDQIGAQPPQSWNDVLALVPKFNKKGIAPFSLAGQSLWT